MTAVSEGVPPRAGRARIGADNRGEQLVDEREDLWRRSETHRDRLPRRSVGPQRLDERRGFVDDSDVGVAETVYGLLPVADNEDRRRNRSVRSAEPFAPALHELSHELPLHPAGVLEFVDEHMTVPRLEAEAALRELVHVLQQPHGALEHPREIEQR